MRSGSTTWEVVIVKFAQMADDRLAVGAEEAQPGPDQDGSGGPLAVLAVAVAATCLLLLPAAVGLALMLGATVSVGVAGDAWFTHLGALNALPVAWILAGTIWVRRLYRSTAAQVD